MVLSKFELLEAGKLETEEVEIDGGRVIVSELGATEYLQLITDPLNQVDKYRLSSALIAKSVVNESGNRLFSDDEIGAVSSLKRHVYLKLAEASRRLNGLGGDEIKNSEPSLTESSASDSV